jgi:WD40 repeat protein
MKGLQWSVGIDSEESFTPSSRSGAPSGLPTSSEDLVRAYAFLKDGRYFFTANSGKVFVSAFHPRTDPDNTSPTFVGAETFYDLAGYSVSVGLPSQNIAFFANTHGVVRCYDGSTGRIFEVFRACNVSERKIAKFFAQDVETSDGFESVVTLLVPFVQPVPPRIILLQRQEDGEWRILDSSVLLIIPSYVTKEITASLTIPDENERLVQCIGFRNGCIVMLRLERRNLLGRPVKIGSMPPGYYAMLSDAHGKDAVTAMRWVPEGSKKGGWLYSVGRDGNLVVHNIDKAFSDLTDPAHEATLVHQLPVPFGRDLEGLSINQRLGELLVYGFHSTKFVLYNVINSQEIVSIECGGAHRNWAFDIQVSPESGGAVGGTLLWTKASKSNLCLVTEPSARAIRPGLHGREIKTCAIAPKAVGGSSLGPLIATGAEDTDIRLISYTRYAEVHSSEGEFRCVATIRKHDTGVQSLKWTESGKYLFSSGGFEEFNIWRISTVPILGVGVVCESSLPVPRERPEQRISDFVVKEIQNGDDNALEFHITMIYSNSFIKAYRYFRNETGGIWTLLCETQYTTACLTGVERTPWDNRAQIITVATDGHLAIWETNSDRNHDLESGKYDPCGSLSLIRCVGLHQNSIKTISVLQLSLNAVLVLTGGDDNAIGISLLRYDARQGQVSTSSILIPRAHTASITSSVIFTRLVSADVTDSVRGGEGKLRLRAITSGNDQRIKIWDIDIDVAAPGVEGVAVRRAGNQHTAVADVSSIAAFPKSRQERGDENGKRSFLVCGVGLEVWTLGL